MTSAPDPRLRNQLAEALAEKFTSPYGARNPDWDWEKPDGEDNLYHLPVSMADRIQQAPYVVFMGEDGFNSITVPSCAELADVLIAAAQAAARQREAEARDDLLDYLMVWGAPDDVIQAGRARAAELAQPAPDEESPK